jgi:hypothetical protein
MMALRKPVPLWALLLAILVTGSVAVVLAYFPRPPGPDFNLTLSSNPTLEQANRGNSTTVKVESVRGIVSFGIISPSGLDVKLANPFGNNQNQLALGAVGNLTLFTSSVAIGNYSVRVIATGGPTSHYVDLVVRVQDLAIATNTTSLTVARGSSGTVGISMKSLNGLSGNVTLQGYVCYPVVSYCRIDPYVTLRFSPSNLILQPGGSATVILTVTVSSSDTPMVDPIFVSTNRNTAVTYLPIIQLTIV